MNNIFDDTGDYLSTKLKFIINHIFLNGVLEFQVDYKPIELIKDDDPHATANYIITNNLGTIYIMAHGH